MTNVIQAEIDDEELNEAINNAKETFPEFLHEIERPVQNPSIASAMVKLYVFSPDDPNQGDHVWANFLGRDVGDKNRFQAELLSAPFCVDLNVGDSINFSIKSLSDWLYVRNGIAYGAYTVNALRKRMNKAELSAHDANYSFSFPD